MISINSAVNLTSDGKKAYIKADDFGLCESVNLAVAKAHTHGALTRATIMANMRAAEQAARLTGGLKTLGVGVHLDIDPDFILTNNKICNIPHISRQYFSS